MSRDIPTIRLDEAECDVVRTVLAPTNIDWAGNLPPIDQVANTYGQFCANSLLQSCSFPTELASFAKRRTNSGLVLVAGYPLDVHPLDFLFLCASIMGHIDHIEEEGEYLIEVKEQAAKADGANRPSNANSQPFTLHTDLSYSDRPPEFMVLQSIHNNRAEAGFSTFADINEAILHLSTDCIQELNKPQFQFPAPSHFSKAGYVTAPILRPIPQSAGRHFIRFRRDELRSTTRAGIIAIAHLIEALDLVKVETFLEPGSLVITDNWQVLHGRTGFLSNLQAADPLKLRHINRVYIQPAEIGQ